MVSFADLVHGNHGGPNNVERIVQDAEALPRAVTEEHFPLLLRFLLNRFFKCTPHFFFQVGHLSFLKSGLSLWMENSMEVQKRGRNLLEFAGIFHSTGKCWNSGVSDV